jgi:hypothetical protein
MDNLAKATDIAKNIYHFHNDKLAMKYYDSKLDHRKMVSAVLIDEYMAMEWGIHPITTPMDTYEMSWWKYIVVHYILKFRKETFLQHLKDQYFISNFPDEYLVWFQTSPTLFEIESFAIEALTQHILKFLH